MSDITFQNLEARNWETQSTLGPQSQSSARGVPRGLQRVLQALEKWLPRGERVLTRILLPFVFRTRRPRTLRRDVDALPAGAQTEIVAHAGRGLRVWSWGAGPVALLVHGWNGYGAQLREFIEPLLARGYRVVTFDALGHGLSEGRDSNLIAFAGCIEALVNAVGVPKVVIAHSMGGAALAHAMVENPSLRFQRGVFISPPSYPSRWMTTVGEQLGVPPKTLEHLTRAAEQHVGVRFTSVDLPGRVRGLSGELLVIHDEEDRMVPIEDAETLVRSWLGARMTRTRGLGHVRILRDDGVIATAIGFVAPAAPSESRA